MGGSGVDLNEQAKSVSMKTKRPIRAGEGAKERLPERNVLGEKVF